jgi:hypothetical protein
MTVSLASGEQYWTNVLFREGENRTAMVVSGASTISGICNSKRGKKIAASKM